MLVSCNWYFLYVFQVLCPQALFLDLGSEGGGADQRELAQRGTKYRGGYTRGGPVGWAGFFTGCGLAISGPLSKCPYVCLKNLFMWFILIPKAPQCNDDDDNDENGNFILLYFSSTLCKWSI